MYVRMYSSPEDCKLSHVHLLHMEMYVCIAHTCNATHDKQLSTHSTVYVYAANEIVKYERP